MGPMAHGKPTNPLYVALLPVGVLFALTACAFVVMTMRGQDPQRGAETGLVAILAEHGVWIMGVELGALAILTVAAIASDDFWMRRLARANDRPDSIEKLP
jgi:hypothetical protein